MNKFPCVGAQIRACSEYAQKKGLNIIKIYSDSAKSGTSSEREQFQQMIKDSDKKMFSHLIIHKLDRFSRDRYDSAIYKRKLKINGVQILSVLENLDGSSESLMLESVLEGMGQYFSANLARETLKGLKEVAHQCKSTGGIPPLGYAVYPSEARDIL